MYKSLGSTVRKNRKADIKCKVDSTMIKYYNYYPFMIIFITLVKQTQSSITTIYIFKRS